MVIIRQAGRREWIGLAVLTLPCLLYAMDLTVLNLAIPHLSADLRLSSTQLLWIVDIYGFMAAGALITMGTLGDRIGRRRLLLIGAAAFGVTSLLAAWSTSAAMLIAARALLGLAGATVAPSTLSLIRNMFDDPRQRTVAISVWITSFSVGGAIGPLLGGILLEWFWWGSVFLLAVPVMALLLVLGPLLLPEFRDPQAGRLDLVSAALSVAAVLAVIYGLKQLARGGLSWPPALSIVVGLAAGAVFVRRQHRRADPLLDLRLFRSAAFTTALTRSSRPARESRNSGSSSGPSTSSSAITGTASRNTEPHQNHSSSTPPSSGPIAPPTEKAVIHTEMATVRCRGSRNMLRISDRVEGATVAPASPSRARAAISIATLAAQAASSEVAPKAAAPISSSRRRPMRSPRVPMVTRDPAAMNP